MNIRKAKITDAGAINTLYLQAFDESESEMVADLAVSFLTEDSAINVMSFVALEGELMIGHVAFSPVFINSQQHVGYILAPLAVLPSYQRRGIGTRLVKHGLAQLSALGSFMIFVYGDPRYYSRLGFIKQLAQQYLPPYTLQYSEGWQAMKLGGGTVPDGGQLKCLTPLMDSKLW